jgi:3-(3-hydroxy-phenyl)propionate hydroxylase
MDDVYPAGWKVVLSTTASDDFKSASRHDGLATLKVLKLGSSSFSEAEGVLDQWFESHGVQAAIVRPDHYIYGVCKTPQDLTTQLDSLKLA